MNNAKTKHGAEASGLVDWWMNDKFQMTKEFQTPNSQREPPAASALFGHWNLVILWTLVLGPWSLVNHPSLAHNLYE